MLFSITLDFPHAERSSRPALSVVDRRSAFWEQIERSEDYDGLSSYRDLEFKFRARFPEELREALRQYASKNAATSKNAMKFLKVDPQFKLEGVSYGSLKSTIDIIGIEGKDLVNFTLFILGVYAPIAFNNVFNTGVELDADVKVLGAEENSDIKGKVLGASAAMLPSAWYIANTSLILPAVIVCYACYVAFGALMSQVEGVRKEAESIRLERSDLTKTLADENVKTAELVGLLGKAALENAKTGQDRLLDLLKDKLNATPASASSQKSP